MKNIVVSILLLAALFCGQIPAIADDEEGSVSLSGEVAFLNMYVWRGIRLTDGPVMQPSATLTVGGFYANVWANVDLDDVNGNEYKFNEVDFTANYSQGIGPVSLFGGVIYYTFPNTDFDSTMEVFVGASLETPLSPTVTVYRDIDLIEGFYVNFAVSHEIPIEGTDGVINLFANASWSDEDYNFGYFGVAKNTLTDFLVGGSLSMGLMEGIGIAPYLAFANFIDSDIGDLYEEPENFVYGVKLTLEF